MTFSRVPGRRQMIAGLGVGALLAALVLAPPAAAEQVTAAGSGLDRKALQQALDGVRDAGMYGVYSEARDGEAKWRGASGVADVVTKRSVRPWMQHRVGSITKTFTAVAILQQVERGRIELDAPIARYLPDLTPGERGQKITVRMLLNHTSGIGDYVAGLFPSLLQGSAQSLDDNRFRSITTEEVARTGLEAPATGEPGHGWSYSNTNYMIAGLLLKAVTGTDAEKYITSHVIRKAGLAQTYFPRTPFILGSHSKAYEALYGIIDPPRDYSVYDMSWAGTAGAVVSTTDDLNRFYRALLTGRLVGSAQLAQMQSTVPVTDAQGNVVLNYGLGIYAQDTPCGRFWGHDGAVFGMGTFSLSSQDGRRQLTLGMNLMKYQHVNEQGQVEPHAIDFALSAYMLRALCGQSVSAAKTQPRWEPFPTQQVLVKK